MSPDSSSLTQLPTFTPQEFCFLPLGGCGEIGMNLNLYGFDGKWLMVDCGITFHDERLPNVEVLMADPSFIVAQKDNLVGLVLTHAHEDHLGAVPYLWPQLECPIYATPFTASVLRRKLKETGFGKQVPIHTLPLSGTARIAPFDVQLITLTHSIPEPNAVVIRTAAGGVLHTGDWKLDPEPQIGETTDEEALRALRSEKLLAMVCDSTNALQSGHSGSEGDAARGLMDVMQQRTTGKIAVACFATNVARLRSIAKAAEASGRVVALAGRSLWRIYEAAKENGYLTDVKPFVEPQVADMMEPHEVCYLCTGSQGEGRAALARIARGAFNDVSLGEGDCVIFSSRVIPGNEKSIGRLHNALAARGIDIITDKEADVHVSGHPAQEELEEMYRWVQPRTAIPVHGEARHLQQHAKLALQCQVPQALLIENGHIVGLSGSKASVLGCVPTGRLAVHGSTLISTRSALLRDLGRTLDNGYAVVSLVIDEEGTLIDDPKFSTIGTVEGRERKALEDDLGDELEDELASLPEARRRKDDAVIEVARKTVRRLLQDACGKRPYIDVHLYRLEDELVED